MDCSEQGRSSPAVPRANTVLLESYDEDGEQAAERGVSLERNTTVLLESYQSPSSDEGPVGGGGVSRRGSTVALESYRSFSDDEKCPVEKFETEAVSSDLQAEPDQKRGGVCSELTTS